MANLSDEFTAGELGELFAFLDGVRASGMTNMFGAGSALTAAYGIDEALARKVLVAWMQSFSKQVQPAERASEVLK